MNVEEVVVNSNVVELSASSKKHTLSRCQQKSSFDFGTYHSPNSSKVCSIGRGGLDINLNQSLPSVIMST